MDSSDRLKLLHLAMENEDEGSLRSSRSDVWDPPSEADLDDSIPGYQIEKLIAIGGMAAVYRALDSENRPVALKLMPAEFEADPLLSTRFESEMKILSGLEHDNIVHVSSTGTTPDGLRYIAMEYLPGGTLRGKRSLREALDIMSQICAGLQHSHSRGIIHRDLKPSNILLTRDGKAKIADFGLAKREHTTSEAPSLTLTGAQLGTPHYMAPEMLAEVASSDSRSDIYSMGVMLYQMLTGKIPVGRYEKVSRVVQVPKSTDAILAKAMAVDPEKRFQSVEELRIALDRLSRSREIAKQRIAITLSVLVSLGFSGMWIYRLINPPLDGPIIQARLPKSGESLPWQSEKLWGRSPFEDEEWARVRDFSAQPGARLHAKISEAGRNTSFRGQNLFLRPGSDLQMIGSAGVIRATPLVLDGGRVTLIDDRKPPTNKGGFRRNSRNLGAVIAGNIQVNAASQIVREGPGIGPEIRSSLSGSAPLIFGQTESLETFVLSGDTSQFSGPSLIEGLVRIDSPLGFGSGPVWIGTGHLWIAPLPAKAEEHNPATVGAVFVSTIGKLLISRNTTLRSLTIAGEKIAPGEYDSESDLANRTNITLSANLLIRESSGAPPNVYLPKRETKVNQLPNFIATSDGEWSDPRIWTPRSSVRSRYTGSNWLAAPLNFRIAGGTNLELGFASRGINYFNGSNCVLEDGSSIEFIDPGSILVFPRLQLEGGSIRHRINPTGAILSATLAGDLQVNQPTDFHFAPGLPDSPPNRLFVFGRLSGKGDITVYGHDRAFLTIGAETSGYEGNWNVHKGGLGALDPTAFENATVKLLGPKSQFGSYRLPILRIKRIESNKGAAVTPVKGIVWIDEWIHAGQPVPPGIYQDHPAIYFSESIKQGHGKVIVGYETQFDR